MTKFLALLLFLPTILLADINQELNSFFDKFGASANVTGGSIYNGQKAGYVTGGGVAIRGRVMNSHLVTVNLPRFDAGCGGIDIYAGGFSFLNKQEFVQTLKGLGTSVAGYSFLLSMELISPQVSNAIKQMQTWSNAANAMNINSCELGSTMVGAVWPKRTAAHQQICRTMGSQKGIFQDWVEARHGCGQEAKYREVSKKVSEDPMFNSILQDQFNLAWEAIQKQSIVAQNRELAEFLMTLMGTIVSSDDKNGSFQVYPSKIEDEEFLHTLLEGGTATIYSCKKSPGNRCLVLNEKQVVLSADSAWCGRVQSLLLAIQAKILKDEELDANEVALLQKTRVPVYRVVNAMTAYRKGYCPVDLYQLAHLIAMDLLMQYLEEAVSIVRDGALQLRRSQIYSDEIDGYLQSLDRIGRVIQQYNVRTSRAIDEEWQLIQKLDLIERQLAAEIVL
jgi:conjugative transfer pilus assembly protein TraH